MMGQSCAGFANGLGNWIIYTSILQCLASISDNNQIDLILDDGWQTEARKAIQLMAENSPFIRKVVGYPSGYNARQYQHQYMSFHSIVQSRFFQFLHGEKILERQNYVCWADLWHEQEFYLQEIRTQLRYKGPVYEQYVPVIPFQRLVKGPYIVVANGYSKGNEGIWERKAYPHFAELLDAILRYDKDLSVVFVGDEEDGRWAKNTRLFLDAYFNRTHNVCGKLSVLETIAVIKQAQFGIYNDGFAAHVADALKTPGVVLWGSTLISKNGGLNGTLINLRSPCLCAPCQGTSSFSECKNSSICMSNIPVGWIMAAIRKNFLTIK